jgi:threonine dehydratase
MPKPTIDDIRAAANRIAPHIHRTPVVTSATFDREIGAKIFFKCENLQKVGAFKARGAVNAIMLLDDEAAGRGVITHSSGNHGAALAFAASIRGIPCTVVMPEGAPAIKVEAVRGYGADIFFCKQMEREAACARLIDERGQTLIHPFENRHVIAGQGTAALELLEEAGGLDIVIAPVGGGGLLSGTAVAVKGLLPGAEIWGAEPEAVDDAYHSLMLGRRQPAPQMPDSCADGLLTGLGQLAFEILRDNGVNVVTMTEDEILQATLSIMQRMKLVVEPSGATVLAGLRRMAGQVRGKRIGAIFSGGNTDFRWLAGIP